MLEFGHGCGIDPSLCRKSYLNTLFLLCKEPLGMFVPLSKQVVHHFSNNGTSDPFPLHQDQDDQQLQASCSTLADLQLYSTKPAN